MDIETILGFCIAIPGLLGLISALFYCIYCDDKQKRKKISYDYEKQEMLQKQLFDIQAELKEINRFNNMTYIERLRNEKRKEKEN